MANEQVIEIYGNSASALSTFTTELIRNAVKDGTLGEKVAAQIPGVKLSVLSYSGDLLKIKIAYDSGDANNVGQTVFEAVGGAIFGGAGVIGGRMLSVFGPWWGVGGAVVGGD